MRTHRPTRRFRRLYLLGPVLALLCFAADARADGLVPIFVGTTPSGSNTIFHYDLVFTTVVNAGTPVERLQAGDFITIYDIPGQVGGSVSSGWGISGAFTGPTAPGTTPIDSPALNNITFTYNGPTITTDTLFTGFSFVVTGTPGLAPGQFTSTGTRNSGAGAGTTVGHSGGVTIAAPFTAPVPEPATIVLLGTGLAGLAGASRRASRGRRRSSRT